jgi:hypothetical protein
LPILRSDCSEPALSLSKGHVFDSQSKNSEFGAKIFQASVFFPQSKIQNLW